MSRALDTALRTAIGVVAIPGFLMIVSALQIVLGIFGARQRLGHDAVYLAFSRFALWVAGTRLVIRAKPTLPADGAWVIVSNHRGNWDPMCIMLSIPEHIIRFVIKAELMNVPLFGRGLRYSGNLVVARRGSGGGDADAIREGMETRDPDVSMLFFAEGHRYDDPGVRPFKTGAFATALATGLSVLPVAVAGTDEVFPRGRVLLRRGTVVVEIGEPISIDELSFEDREELRDRTHAEVSALYERAEKHLEQLRAEG